MPEPSAAVPPNAGASKPVPCGVAGGGGLEDWPAPAGPVVGPCAACSSLFATSVACCTGLRNLSSFDCACSNHCGAVVNQRWIGPANIQPATTSVVMIDSTTIAAAIGSG